MLVKFPMSCFHFALKHKESVHLGFGSCWHDSDIKAWQYTVCMMIPGESSAKHQWLFITEAAAKNHKNMNLKKKSGLHLSL